MGHAEGVVRPKGRGFKNKKSATAVLKAKGLNPADYNFVETSHGVFAVPKSKTTKAAQTQKKDTGMLRGGKAEEGDIPRTPSEDFSPSRWAKSREKARAKAKPGGCR